MSKPKYLVILPSITIGSDNSKLLSFYTPKISLEEGIPRALNYKNYDIINYTQL